MSRKNVYYLIARDRDTNQFRVIDTTNQYGSSLEEIDLFTTCFDSENTMVNVLFQEGKVDSNHLDFFIAHQKKTNGKRILYTQEVLYSKNQEIREIAKASSQGKIENEKNNSTHIFHNFCYKMKHNQSFYDMVLYGHTNLYSKFISYFSNRRFLDSAYLKYIDGGWILKSYPTIRGMIEACQLYEDDPKGVVFLDNVRYRNLLEKDLLTVTDYNYDPHQINMFDFIDQDSLEHDLMEHNLLEQKEVDKTNGYTKRNKGRGA